ncbi:dihydrofolate reductase family protein [Hamadaea tsunoensis]|uniref:dihydrofolate reductase family protein n=1 Tax=Hamadaea tsunoensis TaxID=53368 RepID=UPI00040F7E7A|nr:dihydrofolate reductase family protein [Hamadaea tsunoensis]
MRKVVALVFNYSLNGLLADPATDFWDFAFSELDEQGGPDADDETLALLGDASAHVMGRVAYEGMAGALPTKTDHPWSAIMNAGRKVVFSRTMTTADWSGTSIASGDTAEEIDRLRLGGDGHILVWGGVRLWRSLMRLDLIDEFRISMYPYITSQGTLMFDDMPKGYRLDLLDSTAKPSGILELHYGRHR